MLALLLNVLIALLVFGAVWYIIGLIGLPANFVRIAQIVIAVLFAIYLIGLLAGGLPWYQPNLRLTP